MKFPVGTKLAVVTEGITTAHHYFKAGDIVVVIDEGDELFLARRARTEDAPALTQALKDTDVVPYCEV